jgi:chromosome segregation ATPase
MELSEKEKEKASFLKEKFSTVREEIESIQAEMDILNKKAGTLIKELEELRDQESKFIRNLKQKYGEGTLDPFKLIYMK